MTVNPLRTAWAENRPTLNGWLSIGSSFAAEIMADQGYDSIGIDLQHGVVDYSAALGMLQAMRASDVTPLVRVHWLDAGIIMKSLDAGAMGIICPMINTGDQAAQFVDHVRYPPQGSRSYGPTRAGLVAGPDYWSQANDDIVAFAMVETRQALDNLEAIAATPGLDGIYVGPADLAFSLSKGRLAPGFDRQEPEMIAALQRIASTCHAAGIVAALHCATAEYAARAIDWGFAMTTVSNDARLLAGASAASVARFRELVCKGGN